MELHLIPMSFGLYFTCGACGRVIPSAMSVYARRKDQKEWEEELGDWLIYITDTGTLYVRCPQHVTERTLQATMGRTNEKRRWAQEAKERDAQRTPTNPIIVPVSSDALD